MKKFTKVIAVVLAVAFVAAAFAACSGGSTKEKAKLTLATSADFPPYEFVGDNGDYVGIDIEIAKAIADKLGRELVVENMDFDSIVGAVSTGKTDMGMAGLTVTPDRLESVDFSSSYAKGIQAVIVREDSAIKTVDDLYADGATYKVGAQLSTTGDIYFGDDIAAGDTTCTLEEYQAGADAVAALVAGKIDAVIIDNEPAKSFVAANSGLKILDTEYANEDYAIAFPKNSALVEDVNKALEELIADGTVQKIVDTYIPAK
ncbi:MAG: transporter substrate-binding domain-containing protein [Eubacterium sp.]|nr:transporter substrate-binding domain-containing protein [Eubacterium sp.]